MDIFDDDDLAADPPIELEIWAEASGRFAVDGAVWVRRAHVSRRAFDERPQNSWVTHESGERTHLELVGFGDGRDRREYYVGQSTQSGEILWIDLANAITEDDESDMYDGHRIEDLD